MKSILQQIKSAELICEIYTNRENTDSFSVGYVLSIDNDYAIFQLYDPDGLFDGFRVMTIESIYTLKTNTNYLYKLQKKMVEVELSKDFSYNDNLLINFLNHVQQTNELCQISVCDSDYYDSVGFVKSIFEDKLFVNQINPKGKSDGEAYIMLPCVTSVDVCNQECEAIKKRIK